MGCETDGLRVGMPCCCPHLRVRLQTRQSQIRLCKAQCDPVDLGPVGLFFFYHNVFRINRFRWFGVDILASFEVKLAWTIIRAFFQDGGKQLHGR